MSYDFDMALKNFESDVRAVYPDVGDGLLEFLMQQKLKDRDVSLYPRCNAVFDTEAATIFEKERMKKKLAHRKEQARQKHPNRRVEGQSSSDPQKSTMAPISRIIHNGVIKGLLEVDIPISMAKPREIQWVEEEGGNSRLKWLMLIRAKVTPSVHSSIVFPADGETYPKESFSPVKLDKGKTVVNIPVVDKDNGANLDEEYFKEGDEEMVGTISIIPTEYLGEYEGNPEDDFDMDDEEAFSFIRYEDEPGYF
ncbi:hypothetical protein Ahy_A07g033024 [Arachis hypogaea]|uniref:Uncharacterized protein n=1 Tax=Arachis hypogaea TaxID=3818 RepID=A0A445C833_ARAHY|nr:hypothetical protein Ahy_A07g033024 [Arachis hypogaea]